MCSVSWSESCPAPLVQQLASRRWHAPHTPLQVPGAGGTAAAFLNPMPAHRMCHVAAGGWAGTSSFRCCTTSPAGSTTSTAPAWSTVISNPTT